MKLILIGISIFTFISLTGQSNCEGVDLEVVISGSNFCDGESTILNVDTFSSYLWSTGDTAKSITVGSSGTYFVTVTDDNGCTGESSITVIEYPIPAVDISGSISFCSNSSTTLSASEGFSTYLWSTGETTPSIAVGEGGTYLVTVTDENGCPGTSLFTVEEYPLPNFNLFGHSSFCTNSSITITATGDFATYEWSTGDTSNSIEIGSSGIFFVTVTDENGCSGTRFRNIRENPIPDVEISGSTAFCLDGSTTLSASEGFLSYLWSTGDTTKSVVIELAGIYSLTVTDENGCVGTDEIEISLLEEVNPVINVSYGSCTGILSIAEADIYDSIEWSTGETTQSIEVAHSGEYSVIVGFNGCQGEATINYSSPVFDTIQIFDTTYIEVIETIYDTVQVIDTTSVSVTDTLFIDVNTTDVNDVILNLKLKVYPNPSSEFIIVEIDDHIALSNFKFEIVDISGILVYEMPLTQKIFSINAKDIGPTGTYFIILRNIDGNQIENKTLILR